MVPAILTRPPERGRPAAELLACQDYFGICIGKIVRAGPRGDCPDASSIIVRDSRCLRGLDRSLLRIKDFQRVRDCLRVRRHPPSRHILLPNAALALPRRTPLGPPDFMPAAADPKH